MITSLASQEMHLGDARSPGELSRPPSRNFLFPVDFSRAVFFVVKENDRKEMVTVGVIY